MVEERQQIEQLEHDLRRYRRRIVELKALAVQPCAVSRETARTCERGTRGCYVEHDDGEH